MTSEKNLKNQIDFWEKNIFFIILAGILAKLKIVTEFLKGKLSRVVISFIQQQWHDTSIK